MFVHIEGKKEMIYWRRKKTEKSYSSMYCTHLHTYKKAMKRPQFTFVRPICTKWNKNKSHIYDRYGIACCVVLYKNTTNIQSNICCVSEAHILDKNSSIGSTYKLARVVYIYSIQFFWLVPTLFYILQTCFVSVSLYLGGDGGSGGSGGTGGSSGAAVVRWSLMFVSPPNLCIEFWNHHNIFTVNKIGLQIDSRPIAYFESINYHI